jgi:hypothetical protein
MPETYKSYLNIVGVTSATTIFSGISGTSIVNSINVANESVSSSNYITLDLVRGLTGYSIITGALVPPRTSFQAVDAPLILEQNDTLRATAGFTFGLDIIVSMMQIT